MNRGLYSQEHFTVTSRSGLEEKARMEIPLPVGGITKRSLGAPGQVQDGTGRLVCTLISQIPESEMWKS